MSNTRWLDRATEFRFDYWHTEDEYLYLAVRRGVDQYADGWTVANGHKVWNGQFWDPNARGHAMFCYERDEALEIAERLAFEMNQAVIARQEERFPGEFRGGPYDMAAQAVTT